MTLAIVLPIGDLRHTLVNSIKSVLNSGSNNFELIISNNTQEELKLPLEIMSDHRVKMINHPVRLGMAEHWLDLLRLTESEWVCFMGADDGVITRNLEPLIQELSNSNSHVISTHRVEAFFNNTSCAEWVIIPETKCTLEKNSVKWNSFLGSLSPNFFFDLPMPYNKAVFRRDILNSYLSKGHELYGLTPDYFLSFLVSINSKTGTFFDLPVFIHGSSESSNGWQYQNHKQSLELSEFLQRINPQEDYLRQMPTGCVTSWLANSYLAALFSGEAKNEGLWFRRAVKTFLGRIYKLWVVFTCVHCSEHTNRNSENTIEFRRFINDKIASGIRNYFCPLVLGRRFPVHSSTMKILEPKLTIDNLHQIILF